MEPSTHEERVAEICDAINGYFAGQRKHPTVEGCVLLVVSAYEMDSRAFGGGQSLPGNHLAAWWLVPHRWSQDNPFSKKAPAQLLYSRRGRKALIAWAEKVIADKRERDRLESFKKQHQPLRTVA